MPEIRVVVSDDLDRYMNTIVNKGMFGSKAELIRAALVRYFETLPLRVPSGYDDTTIFSPDGRLFQVEYALECAYRGSIIIGLQYRGGVILAKQRPSLGRYPEASTIISTPWERYEIDRHIGALPSGIASDFIVLKEKATKEARRHKEETGKPIRVEDLVRELAIFMQSYTMKKDARPLGCIIFIGGVDPTGEQHLFALDPSGSYNELSYSVIGYQSEETQRILRDNYKPNMPLQEALSLIMKAVLKDDIRKPEELAVVAVEKETKELRVISSEEMEEAWKIAFKKEQE